MLKMKACLEIMEKKDLEKEDVTGIETALDTLPVKPAYQQKMLTRIILTTVRRFSATMKPWMRRVERTS